jgi:acyl-CoA thioesterase I
MTNRARRVGICYSLAAVVATTSCASADAPTAPSVSEAAAPVAARRGVVLVLGDSLAVSPSRSEAFPAELQKRLEASARGWTVKNASVSGDTTSGGLRRFNDAVTSDTRVLVLELGANDGLRGVEIATVERNLSTMIEGAEARGIRVLLCGMETPPLHGWNYTVEFHKLFPRLAQKYGVALVPFLLEGVALNPDLNGDDEIHPNAAGARVIATTVWPYLEPLVQQPVTAASRSR